MFYQKITRRGTKGDTGSTTSLQVSNMGHIQNEDQDK